MFRTPFFHLLTAVCCIALLAVPAAAAEVDSGSVYCFSPEDFSDDPALAGICITALPDSTAGTLLLDHRVLQPGDILTAGQVAKMTFSPLARETDATAQVEFLPVFAARVSEPATVTIGIRGREDKAPVAEDSALETYKNLPNNGNLKARDPEGQALTYTVTRQPRRGTVTVNADGSFTYTPKKNKVGVDSFVYTAADPGGKVSREATVTVTILKPTEATQYTDTVGRDCRFAAEWMKHTGIFVGEQLGDKACFCPDRQVSRGEFVTMLVKALEIPEEEALSCTGYEDAPQWLQPYLAAAMRSGLTAGLEARETFRAEEPITEAEARAMVRIALDRDTEAVFGERGETPLTREQAAAMLYEAATLNRDRGKRELA